jgi:hypothetical protein
VPAPPGSIGLFAVVLNLFFAAYFIVSIAVAQARGVPSGEIGIMAAMFGVGGILGALAAPYLQRRVTPFHFFLNSSRLALLRLISEELSKRYL